MKRLLLSIFITFFLIVSFGQGRGQNEDPANRVRLIIADSLTQVEIDSVIVRKAYKPTFFHNNAYLFCDTAYFIMDQYIDAIGNVRIEQEGTNLYSDKIHYIIPEDVAQVRGRIVRLVDKDNNILMTNFLDYNTKDSIATFFEGGSMKDKDGNVIEGDRGTYDTKTKIFTFNNNVQMFSDTLFFISDYIRYEADLDVAYFGKNTHGWRAENYLSAGGGRYERANEFVNFVKDVYVESKEQEILCDTLDYYMDSGDVLLLSNIQIRDTTQNIIILGDKLEYYKESQDVLITKFPGFLQYTTTTTTTTTTATPENEQESVDSLQYIVPEPLSVSTDTLFATADTLHLFSRRMYEIDSAFVSQAITRKKLAHVDPVAEFRKKNTLSEGEKGEISETAEVGEQLPQIDVDTVTVETRDTTKIDFLLAYHNVKIYREDMQIVCDSMIYSGIDSIARLFKEPILWNNIKNQLTADSMQMIVEGGRFTKGNLISNSFIATDEGNDFYNQIKGTEMTGFFNENNEIYRYDVLGGASTIIYITEEGTGKISSMNSGEGKMLSVILENQEVNRVTFFETIKNNLTPVAQIKADDKFFKGFKWMPERRPESRFSVTDRKIHPSGRSSAPRDLFPAFKETKIYFPDYIENILREIAYRDSINRILDQERSLRELAEQDSLAMMGITDSLAIADEIEDSVVTDVAEIPDIIQTAQDKYDALKMEYDQLRSRNKGEMSKIERKEWRREKKRVKKEMRVARKEARRSK